MPFSNENPLAAPPSKPLDPDMIAFTKAALSATEAREMAALVDPASPRGKEPLEDWDNEATFDLSPEERKKMKEERAAQELVMREKITLRKFFGREIHVPAPPIEMTIESLHHWESLGFEPHYLPPEDLVDMTCDSTGQIIAIKPKSLPGWKQKPEDWFFEQIKDGKVFQDATILPGCWVLIDTRQKPDYKKDGEQMYENDPLAPVLEKLREANIIEDYRVKDSRFYLSAEELEKPEVIAAFAEALGTSPQNLSLPSAMEFTVLSNIHHPKWGETNSSEWFRDSRDAGSERLCGGTPVVGSLLYIFGCPTEGRNDRIGFRLIIQFPS